MNLNRLLGTLIIASAMLALTGCASSTSSTPIGVVRVPSTATTVTGSATAGATDGPLSTATFNNPVNVVRDTAGNLYVADFDNSLVRKVSASGVVSTLINVSGFQRPFGLAISGNTLYIGTDDNDSGVHSPTSGTVWKADTTTGNPAVLVRDIGRPRGLAVLPDGRVVVSNINRNTISLLDPNTKVLTPLAGSDGMAGYANGKGTAALFSRPYGVAVGPDGALYVCDQTNSAVRRVALDGTVSTFLGGTAGFRDGFRTSALIATPQGIAFDSMGEMFITDNGNEAIRVIEPSGQVATLAGGNGAGFADGPNSQFFGEEGLTVAPDGHTVYVADGTNGNGGEPYNRVRILTR